MSSVRMDRHQLAARLAGFVVTCLAAVALIGVIVSSQVPL